MNSQHIFLLYIAVGVFFLGWFFAARGNTGSKPTRLNLRRGSTPPPAEESLPAVRVVQPDAGATENARRARAAKDLNVNFVYNGHDWEAYEVLGIPAGAGLPTVTAHYQGLIQTCEGGQRDFYEAAYQAILGRF